MPTDIQPTIILVEPQLAENIGTTARAMANFGLRQLRLVRPRQGWPHDKARAAASGSDHVLEAAVVFDSVAEAIADLRFVFATTARQRDMVKPVRGPQGAAQFMLSQATAGIPTGVMFGRERIGLTNEEVSLADEILTLPVDPTHASLNIAQAVLIVAYEWRRALLGETEVLPFAGEFIVPAERVDLIRLFEHLESALDEAGFFRPKERRPHMVSALRVMLQRAALTSQEVMTLRGAIAALERRPTRPHKGTDGTLSTDRYRDD